MNDKVSIIIPAYNAESTIKRCVSSVINQTYKNIEVIVVDDGSIDKTDIICNKMCQEDKRIIYVKKENKGVSSARNKGIELACGKFIMFVDSDDYIDINLVENLMENVKNYKIIKAGTKIIENSKVKRTTGFNKILLREDFIKEILTGKLGGAVYGYIFDKELINGIKMDENTSHMEDTLFIVEIIKKVDQIPCIDTSYYNYDISKGSITRENDKIYEGIKEYIYSINEISKIIDSKDLVYIEKKKALLLEKELSKISSFKELEDISVSLKEILVIDERNITNKYYKLIVHLYNNENFVIWYLIIRARKVLKKIKKIK